MGEDFLAKSILEGMVYNKTTPQGIVYAASVCYPQTDLYVPISITITADGKMTMVREELLEEIYDEEGCDQSSGLIVRFSCISANRP